MDVTRIREGTLLLYTGELPSPAFVIIANKHMSMGMWYMFWSDGTVTFADPNCMAYWITYQIVVE